MLKITRRIWILLALVAVAAVLVVVPILRRDVLPGWGLDAYGFLKETGEGLRQYSESHNGHLPSSLRELYPRYVEDSRVTLSTAIFGNRRMAIVYWSPKRLGNPRTAVVEVRLNPGTKTAYAWRGFVLWGNLEVKMAED